jgi:hypothetical protein
VLAVVRAPGIGLGVLLPIRTCRDPPRDGEALARAVLLPAIATRADEESATAASVAAHAEAKLRLHARQKSEIVGGFQYLDVIAVNTLASFSRCRRKRMRQVT